MNFQWREAAMLSKPDSNAKYRPVQNINPDRITLEKRSHWKSRGLSQSRECDHI